MKRSWVVVAGLLALPACGIQPTGSLDAGAPARATWEAATVYYLVDGQPYPALRPEARVTDPQELVEVLAAGPTAQERETGLSTEVPASVRLTIDDGRLVVEAPGALPESALDQIACTLSQNGPPGPAGTTLHGPDGAVIHDTGCPVASTSISLRPCSPSWRSTTNPRPWPSSPSSWARTAASPGC